MTLRRVEQQRKQKLMGLNKSMQSKKAAKMAMEKKAQEEGLCHIRKQQRKSRLRALQELAKKVKKKKERRTKDAPKRKCDQRKVGVEFIQIIFVYNFVVVSLILLVI